MLHGGGPGASAWSNFGRNLPVFADRFRTLMVDQPGFGRSDKPPVTATTSRSPPARWRACSTSSASTGCTWSATRSAAARRSGSRCGYPERAGRLVLMGPGGLSLNVFAPDPTEGVRRWRSSRPRRARAKEKMAAFLRTLVFDQRLVTDELVDERYAAASDPEALAAMASLGASFFDPATRRGGDAVAGGAPAAAARCC